MENSLPRRNSNTSELRYSKIARLYTVLAKSHTIAGLPYWNADFFKKSNGTVGSHYGIVDVRFLCIVFFKINMVACLLT